MPAWLPDSSGLAFQRTAATPTRVTNQASPFGVGTYAEFGTTLVVKDKEVVAKEDLFTFPVRWLPDGRFLYTADGKIKIGILNDQSGVYADFGGQWSFEAAKMAVEDFGGKVLGVPVEVITADHQNKADIASNIARQWYDTEQVDSIMGADQFFGRSCRAGAVEGKEEDHHQHRRCHHRTHRQAVLGPTASIGPTTRTRLRSAPAAHSSSKAAIAGSS